MVTVDLNTLTNQTQPWLFPFNSMLYPGEKNLSETYSIIVLASVLIQLVQGNLGVQFVCVRLSKQIDG